MSLTTISPVRFFFRASQSIPSVTHARAIAKEFNRFGDLLEYKFIRCPETHAYLNYGFVTFKDKEHTLKAISETGGFLKMGAPFEQPIDVKLEKTSIRNNNTSKDKSK
ncbi:unnamed protein product [Umbelopsis ramanniana]